MDSNEYAQLLISRKYVQEESHPFVRNTNKFLAEIRANPQASIRLLVGGEDYICSVCPAEVRAKCPSLDFKKLYLYGTPFWDKSMERHSENDDRQVIQSCGLEAGIEQDIPVSQVLGAIKNLSEENRRRLRESL